MHLLTFHVLRSSNVLRGQLLYDFAGDHLLTFAFLQVTFRDFHGDHVNLLKKINIQ